MRLTRSLLSILLVRLELRRGKELSTAYCNPQWHLHLGVLPYALPQPEADASYGARCVTRSCVTHGHPTPVTPFAVEHNEPAVMAFRMKSIGQLHSAVPRSDMAEQWGTHPGEQMLCLPQAEGKPPPKADTRPYPKYFHCG
jgi:hypothetical protein